MSISYISFGANMGDRKGNIEAAYKAIAKQNVGTVLRTSPFYETEPVNCTYQQKFINSVAEIMTDLSPSALLLALRKIETDGGRLRTNDKNAPRTIDIDILLYDYIVINSKDLTIPHPEIEKRLFILRPLSDIRPDLLHPVLQKQISEILESAPTEIKGQGLVQI